MERAKRSLAGFAMSLHRFIDRGARGEANVKGTYSQGNRYVIKGPDLIAWMTTL